LELEKSASNVESTIEEGHPRLRLRAKIRFVSRNLHSPTIQYVS